VPCIICQVLAAGTPDRPFPDIQSAVAAALRGARVRRSDGESRFEGQAKTGFTVSKYVRSGAGVGAGGAVGTGTYSSARHPTLLDSFPYKLCGIL
jgi:hypothetical protein